MPALKKSGPKTDSTYAFRLWMSGANPLTVRNLNALHKARCDDATFGAENGQYYAAFDRAASSYPEAIVSAILAVQEAVPGLVVLSIDSELPRDASVISAINGLLTLDLYARGTASKSEKQAIVNFAKRKVERLVPG
jgi:hypothetical protein